MQCCIECAAAVNCRARLSLRRLYADDGYAEMVRGDCVQIRSMTNSVILLIIPLFCLALYYTNDENKKSFGGLCKLCEIFFQFFLRFISFFVFPFRVNKYAKCEKWAKFKTFIDLMLRLNVEERKTGVREFIWSRTWRCLILGIGLGLYCFKYTR